MEIHNAFTVRGKNGAVTALNTVQPAYYRTMATVPDWARVISLTDDTGERTCLDATILFLCADPGRGGVLRAVYTAEAECPPGKRYVNVSLGVHGLASDDVSRAVIDYESAGETLEITAVVYLALTYADDNTKFCGGDNPLVRRMLGCGTAGQFRIGWGMGNYPSLVMSPSQAVVYESVPATVTASDDGLRFSAPENMQGTELFLCLENTPVLRVLRPYTNNVYLFCEPVGDNKAILIDKGFPLEVFNVRLDDVTKFVVESCRVVDKIIKAGGAPVNLGAEGKVLSDPAEEYLAVVTASYVEVFRVGDGLSLQSLLRLTRTNEYVDLCLGGSLVMWGPSTLTIYQRDANDVYTSFSHSVTPGTFRQVMREGNAYHAVCRRLNNIFRYRVTPDSFETLNYTRITTAYFFMGRCGNAVAWGDQFVRVTTTQSDYSKEYNCDALATRLVKRTMVGSGTYFAAVKEEDEYVVYDFGHNNFTVYAQPLKANGRLVYDDTGVYIYDYYNGLRRLSGDYEWGADVTDACLAGGGLFAVRDGKLYSYFCSGTALAVLLGVESEGKTMVCNVRERVMEGMDRPVRFSLTAPAT